MQGAGRDQVGLCDLLAKGAGAESRVQAEAGIPEPSRTGDGASWGLTSSEGGGITFQALSFLHITSCLRTLFINQR